MDYTQLFTQLAVILITLMFGLITRKLLPWIEAKAGKQTLEFIMLLVKCAVDAAEQVFSTPGTGKEKKQFVIDRVLSIDPNINIITLQAVIEKYVYEMNLSKIAVPDNKVESYDYTAGSQD